MRLRSLVHARAVISAYDSAASNCGTKTPFNSLFFVTDLLYKNLVPLLLEYCLRHHRTKHCVPNDSDGYTCFRLFEPDNQGLYEAALALYQRDVVTNFFSALESPDAAIAEIDQQFAYVADRARRPGIKNGCLMCNSATERASDDLASRAVFADHFDRMSGAFTKALNNAKHRGEIRSDVRTTDEGRFLATTLLGFSVLMRSRVEPKVVVAAARAARRHLKGLMGDSS